MRSSSTSGRRVGRRSHDMDLGGDRYTLSLTAGGGLQPEQSAVLAMIHRDGEAWCSTVDRAFAEGCLHPDTKTAHRVASEIAVRLDALSQEERGLLIKANPSDQTMILWLAACRAYRIVGEFAVEVVSDRHQVFRTDLSPLDFDVFFEAKSISSVKLQTAAKSTRAKIRSLVFRFMREAGIISADGRIHGVLLTPAIYEILRNRPRDQRYFPNHWRRL